MHWKEAAMHLIRWRFDLDRWQATKDGGVTWNTLAADNILDATEALEEAARRTGTSPQLWRCL